jgi:hypothetical protein
MVTLTPRAPLNCDVISGTSTRANEKHPAGEQVIQSLSSPLSSVARAVRSRCLLFEWITPVMSRDSRIDRHLTTFNSFTLQ